MSKNIIIVQNVFEDAELTVQSIDSIRCAAKRWNADFYELNTLQFPDSPNPFFWDRIWEYENFKNYEKVLVLDPDVVINSKAPNIFDEINPDSDFCAVKDGNPGERFQDSGFLRNSIVRKNAIIGNTIEVFQKNIEGFSEDLYWENYFNVGVNLFYPEKIEPAIIKIKNLIINNHEIYKYVNLKDNGSWFSSQNLINAVLTSSGVRVKFLEDKWRYIG